MDKQNGCTRLKTNPLPCAVFICTLIQNLSFSAWILNQPLSPFLSLAIKLLSRGVPVHGTRTVVGKVDKVDKEWLWFSAFGLQLWIGSCQCLHTPSILAPAGMYNIGSLRMCSFVCVCVTPFLSLSLTLSDLALWLSYPLLVYFFRSMVCIANRSAQDIHPHTHPPTYIPFSVVPVCIDKSSCSEFLSHAM